MGGIFWLLALLNALCSPLYVLMLVNALLFQVHKEVWLSASFLIGLVTAIFLRALQRNLPAWIVVIGVSVLNLLTVSHIG